MELTNIATATLAQNNKLNIVYDIKFQQASDFMAGGLTPPELELEAKKKNMSITDLCKTIKSKYEQNKKLNSIYELRRQEAKLSISVAPSKKEIKLILDNFISTPWFIELNLPVSSVNINAATSADDRIVFDDYDNGVRIAGVVHTNYTHGIDHNIARVKNGRLLGGIVYQSYTGSCVELNMAAFDPHWGCRDLIWAIFAYPFIQLNCSKIIARVKDKNQRALRLITNVGFTEESRIKDAFPDGELVVLSMLREDCKWLQMITPHINPWA
jgi:hypothetical protein